MAGPELPERGGTGGGPASRAGAARSLAPRGTAGAGPPAPKRATTTTIATTAGAVGGRTARPREPPRPDPWWGSPGRAPLLRRCHGRAPDEREGCPVVGHARERAVE